MDSIFATISDQRPIVLKTFVLHSTKVLEHKIDNR